MRGRMGDEYIPPATPRKSVLIYVTFGDLLKASQQNAGSKGGGGTGMERAGACGARWPSGARSHSHSQTVRTSVVARKMEEWASNIVLFTGLSRCQRRSSLNSGRNSI